MYRHKLEQNEWQIEIYQSEWLIKIKSNKRVQNWTISLFQHIIIRFIYILEDVHLKKQNSRAKEKSQRAPRNSMISISLLNAARVVLLVL